MPNTWTVVSISLRNYKDISDTNLFDIDESIGIITETQELLFRVAQEFMLDSAEFDISFAYIHKNKIDFLLKFDTQLECSNPQRITSVFSSYSACSLFALLKTTIDIINDDGIVFSGDVPIFDVSIYSIPTKKVLISYFMDKQASCMKESLTEAYKHIIRRQTGKDYKKLKRNIYAVTPEIKLTAFTKFFETTKKAVLNKNFLGSFICIEEDYIDIDRKDSLITKLITKDVDFVFDYSNIETWINLVPIF